MKNAFSVSGQWICMQVNGDAFIGRTYDNGDDFKRLDFKVSEVSSSAAWVQVGRSGTLVLLHSPSHPLFKVPVVFQISTQA